MRIDDQGFIFRIYERAVNFRARALGVMDGDLGMFVRRDIFEKLKGFEPLPYMEDIVFSDKMHKTYPVIVLEERIFVSSRKWHERGLLKTLGAMP